MSQYPAYDVGVKLQPPLAGSGAQGLYAVFIGKQFQPEYQIPAQSGTQVFPQGHGQWRAVTRQHQCEAAARGGHFTPAIVQGEQGRLAVFIQTLHIVHRNKPVRQGFGGGNGFQGGGSVAGAKIKRIVADGDRFQQMAAARAGSAPQVNGAARLTITQGIQGGVVGAGYEIIERGRRRTEEHTSELQSLMRNSYAVLRLKKKN